MDVLNGFDSVNGAESSVVQTPVGNHGALSNTVPVAPVSVVKPDGSAGPPPPARRPYAERLQRGIPELTSPLAG